MFSFIHILFTISAFYELFISVFASKLCINNLFVTITMGKNVNLFWRTWKKYVVDWTNNFEMITYAMASTANRKSIQIYNDRNTWNAILYILHTAY